jgi:hypothetical protein
MKNLRKFFVACIILSLMILSSLPSYDWLPLNFDLTIPSAHLSFTKVSWAFFLLAPTFGQFYDA